MTYHSPAMDHLIKDVELAGTRIAINIAKSRAARYRFSPQYLSALCRELQRYSPEHMIRCIKAITEYERANMRRWIGLGGEDILLNCRGAMIYARYLRAKGRRRSNSNGEI